MPILPQNTEKNRFVRNIDVKFFSSYLTGQGKKTGLVNQDLKPGVYDMGETREELSHYTVSYKRKTTGNNVTHQIIPVGTLVRRTYEQGFDSMMLDVPTENTQFALKLSSDDYAYEIWATCDVQGMILRENPSKKLMVNYRTALFVVPPKVSKDKTERVHEAFITNQNVASFPKRVKMMTDDRQAWALLDWSFAPVSDIDVFPWSDICEATDIPVDDVFEMKDRLREFYDGFNTYENLIYWGKRWCSDAVADDVNRAINSLVGKSERHNIDQVSQIVYQLRYLESYDMPLTAYRKVYENIINNVEPHIAEELVKQNVNLLMNDTLDALEKSKDELVKPPSNVTTLSVDPKFSAQQRSAIQSDKSLILVQAGAGSGKSTVVLSRIDHLVNCGVDPSDITVLSFTNAAADNIIKRNPKVHSMTIARMVHELYKSYFPSHELSSLETIANALMIYLGNTQFAIGFADRLRSINGRESEGSFTMLNSFVEANLEQVVDALNLIKQTSLELEIVLAYQMIDRMPLPADLKIKYLIIDEVQDNSIFEFIYLLRLANKLKCSMFLVGDASQTLYEFRSANPKALNALEMSNVFTPYKLETNYRSNQEILDFANIHLDCIEANQNARISLRANEFTQVTSESFQEKVQVHYEQVKSAKQFKESLPTILTVTVSPYIDECLARGENVTFLAFTRNEVEVVEKFLHDFYPDREVISLISQRRRATTLYSNFIRDHWSDIETFEPSRAPNAFTREVIARSIVHVPKSVALLQQMNTEWWLYNSGTITGWIGEYNNRIITREVFFDRLKKSILAYEVRYNAIIDALLQKQNEEDKLRNIEQKPDFFVSTIHGVKGLEFDNVVLLHDSDKSMKEDMKRLYYVALTRAMKTEFIVSHGFNKSSQIVNDYDLIIERLESE